MNRTVLLAIVLIVFIISLGCQAAIYGTASELNRMELGMSKEEVIELMGKPVSISMDGDKGEEYLIYKKMKHAISAWPRTYKITLRNGKVVKWDEQYDEKNMNLY